MKEQIESYRLPDQSVRVSEDLYPFIPTKISQKMFQASLFQEVVMQLKAKQTLYGAEFFQRGLFDRDLTVYNAENIPTHGPLLIVANHNNEGVWGGFDQIAAMSYVIERARQGSGSVVNIHRDKTLTAPRWVQAAEPKKSSTLARITRPAKYYEMLSHSFQTILVDREGKEDHVSSGRKIFSVLRHGGIIGLFPEGDASTTFQSIDPQAEKLLQLITKLNHRNRQKVPILPIASWIDNKREISVSIGKHIISPTEDIGISVMKAIAALLPQDKRGIYARL